MRKIMLSWTLVLAVAGLTLMSCKKDKNENPEPPKESTVKDERDGKEYKTIKIGDQTWFSENLRYTGTIAAGYINDPYGSSDSTKKYGPLYTWEAANLACPKGWHLPTDEEWKKLEYTLGMSAIDTAKSGYGIKRGTDKNLGLNLQVGGESGFNFVVRASENMEEVWTKSAYSDTEYFTRYFSKKDNSVYRWSNGKGASICVRCLKD